MTAKTLFSGTTHVTGGRNGAARSSDGFVDLQLPAPHPAAEQLFAAAWSACFIGALELAAGQRKIKLPASPELDTTIAVVTTKIWNAITPPPMMQALAITLYGDDVDFGLTIEEAMEPNLSIGTAAE